DAALEAVLDGIGPEDVALRVYTSGTTGVPKGAELNNEGISAVMRETVDFYAHPLLDEQQRNVSYLPLCHAAEQIFTNFVSLEVASEIYFCPELEQLRDYLVKARPTFFLGVPRVWEKFEAALRARLGQASGLRKSLANWALGVEEAAILEGARTGREVGGFQRSLARKLVISKIQGALGLDALKFAISGAAPISESTLRFFASLGILIHEGYGMTETSGVATAQPYMEARFGTVGKVGNLVDAKIGEGQELLLRGPNMVRSYHKLPEKTAELWTEDGWMRTGDMASIDEDGFVKIIGRVKDLIITAGGKNVGPGEMENHLLGIIGVGQAVAIGDRRPYITALLVLDPD
ncbi:MAG: AMP-binding protein, partial [Myxococcota bacterium]